MSTSETIIREEIDRLLAQADRMGGVAMQPVVLHRLRQAAMTEASSAIEALEDDDHRDARRFLSRLGGIMAAMRIVFDEMGG